MSDTDTTIIDTIATDITDPDATTIDTSLSKQRSIAELGQLNSYSEMTDEEIERFTQWRIQTALTEQECSTAAEERKTKAQAQLEYFNAQKELAEMQLKILVEEQKAKAEALKNEQV